MAIIIGSMKYPQEAGKIIWDQNKTSGIGRTRPIYRHSEDLIPVLENLTHVFIYDIWISDNGRTVVIYVEGTYK